MSLPEWPIPNSHEAVTFFAAAREVASAWKAKSVSNPFTLAMVAQAEAESSLNPNAKGDWLDADGRPLTWMKQYPPGAKPTSFGLYQRKQDRLKAIKAATMIDLYAAVMAEKNTIGADVNAAWWELENLPWAGKVAIERQHTAYMAAWEATVMFEKAGAVNAATRRANMAERWAVWFQDNGGI